MKKFRTPYNYDPEIDSSCEIASDELNVIPDQAMSIVDILAYSRSGADLNMIRQDGYYEDEDDTDDDFSDMNDLDRDDLDIVEITEFSNKVKQAMEQNNESGVSEPQKSL